MIGQNRTRGNQRIGDVREHRCMPVFIDHVDGKPIACLHQDIEIHPFGMHRHPPGVIFRRWGINAVDKRELACLAIFLVRPDLVSSQVGRIEVVFPGIKDHSMYSRLGHIRVILNIGFNAAALVDGENITVASMIVERISIDIVRWLLGG